MNVEFGNIIQEDDKHTELPLLFGAPQRRLTGPPPTCASFHVSLFRVWQGLATWMTRDEACAITELDGKQIIMKDCGSDVGRWYEELPTVGHGWSGAACLGVHDDVYQ